MVEVVDSSPKRGSTILVNIEEKGCTSKFWYKWNSEFVQKKCKTGNDSNKEPKADNEFDYDVY